MAARILVVDDNPTNLDLMVYLLNAWGHDATGIGTPGDGLQEVLSGNYDLVLSDILMPGFDGYEFARRVKSDVRTAKIPLIAVTALAMVGDRDRALAAGFDGYISKPIDPQTFVQRVDAFLPASARASTRRSESPVPSNEVAVAPTGPLILAVDDVQLNLDVIHGALEPFGYRVCDARSVAEAVERISALRPALIVCDVHMPSEDGFALIERLRVDPVTREVPFVFLTSTALRPAEKARGLGLGASDFVLRPIDPEKLVAVVRQALTEKNG